MPKAIPEGMHSVTPALTVDGCADAIETWKKALGAEEIMRAPDPSGRKVWHAAVRIGDSVIFCNDAMPEMPAAPKQARLWIYLDGVEGAVHRAHDPGV
jgi:PhnB protein